MSAQDSVREQLLFLLRGGNAHMSLEEAIAGFPMAHINSSMPGSTYTPWRLLEHIRLSQWDILEFIIDPQYVSPPWPVGYWPPEGEQADPVRWEKTLTGYFADHKALEDLVEDPAVDLFSDLPHAPGYSILREILVVSDHNAYHVGEFGLLKTALGIAV